MSGSFIYRHHVETQSQALLAERGIIPYSSKNTLTYPETTQTNLDVKQEKPQSIDYWNIDGSRGLVGSLDRFHTIYSIGRKKPPDGYMWSGGRLTRKTAYIQGQIICGPELWKINGKACQAEGEAKVV